MAEYKKNNNRRGNENKDRRGYDNNKKREVKAYRKE